MALLDDAFSGLTDIRVALGGSDQVGCHVFIFSPPTRERRDQWLKIAMDGVVAAQLARAASEFLAKTESRAADDQALAEFDFGAMAAGSIGILRITDVPAIGEWLACVPPDDWSARFDGDEHFLERARFYVTRLNFSDGRHLVLFRGSRGLSVTLRKKGAVAAMFSRERNEMVAIEGEVISFDGSFDFFVWDSMVFIANLQTFESITNIRDITIRKSSEALDVIGARFNLGPNAAALKNQIGKRTRLAKKLAAAHQHGLVADIDNQRLVDRAKERQLRFGCNLYNGSVRFRIDHEDKDQVNDFVDLMTDFFLQSPVTHREWEAIVKRTPRHRHVIQAAILTQPRASK